MAKKKKRVAFKKARKGKVGRGKPKGKPPAALQGPIKRKKKRGPKLVAPSPRKLGLLDAVGEVICEVEELAQEMRSWADNMPESKQSSSKYDEVDSCASTLEEQQDPVDNTTMAFLNEVKFEWQDPTPRRRGFSRSARLGHATDLLTEIITQLETYIGDNKHGPNEATAGELKDALEDIESELMNVDFPGMFG